MRFFGIDEVTAPRYLGEIRAQYEFYLPGTQCPTCGASGGGIGEAYPAVDPSSLPGARKLSARLEKDFAEFTRLRELVLPLVPPGVPLAPGTTFGPLKGRAWGDFPPLYLPNPWTLLARREALEQLQADGLKGLLGCRTELRFRGKNPPDLLELQIEPHGLLHPDCVPPGKATPCPTCGRYDFSLPKQPILAAATLPTDRDLFRLANFQTVIVATERFVDSVHKHGFDEVDFRELPTRGPGDLH